MLFLEALRVRISNSKECVQVYLNKKSTLYVYDTSMGKYGKPNTYLGKVVNTVEYLYGWALHE